LRYDALLLGLGARIRPRYEHVLTIDDRHLDSILHGLIQDVEDGYVKHLAFIVPARMAWPLPIYELALMTAARAHDMGIELAVTIATPEKAPLAIFGKGASTGVSKLLAESNVTVVTSARCEVPRAGHITVNNGLRRIAADRIVALPELYGPAVRGVPGALNGFIPVDPHCKVRSVERVYAAGDATDFVIKHGGVSAQQADAAAEAIAALAGVEISPEPFHPVIRGILLTGGKPRYLSAHVTGGHGFASHIDETPTWSPPTKIAAKYLAPYLDELDHEGAGAR
jgi:sulfide:quinone oxidoreductase